MSGVYLFRNLVGGYLFREGVLAGNYFIRITWHLFCVDNELISYLAN